MADDKLVENVVNDLVKRVQTLEDKTKNVDQVNDALSTIDKASFGVALTLESLLTLLVEKGIITKEEFEKAIEKSRDEVVKTLGMKEENKS